MNIYYKFFHSFYPSEPGFLYMWALLAVSIIAVALILERFIYLQIHSGFVRTSLFANDVLKFTVAGNYAEAIKVCSRGGRIVVASILKAGLLVAHKGISAIQNAVDEEGLNIIPKLEQRTPYLAMIGNVATLIGLMGTIYGLILAFSAVGQPGIDPAEKSNLLAQGISAAMFTTLLGLMIAIPSIAIFSYYQSKTQRMIDEIDSYALKLINILSENTYKTHKYHISATQLKEGIGLHIRHNNIKIYADNKLIKEVNM